MVFAEQSARINAQGVFRLLSPVQLQWKQIAHIIIFQAENLGKLLTPNQGCGITEKIARPRIVGGTNANLGKLKPNIYNITIEYILNTKYEI